MLCGMFSRVLLRRLFGLLMLGAAAAVPFTGPGDVTASEKGAFGGFTGAPGEDTCRHCHKTYALNIPVGTISVDGFPETYVPGESYEVTVSLVSTSGIDWGFQATVLTEKHKRAGKFFLTDREHTKVVTGVFLQDRIYVEQTKKGHYDDQRGGASWTFTWQAPKTARGACTIYVCGNIGNDNGKPSGDFILYTDRTAVPAT